ncbi:hypothetical protein Nepgr_006782 [Nepenthes gracilis]|uniref:Secreted protein n=1 Tax=Nepenthes gracilis TaxID=150966 RepID=A0AAD3S5N3_NEPGR|nr:hypothetical protein Nepgr_006782 [Nepenthes gracilis]
MLCCESERLCRSVAFQFLLAVLQMPCGVGCVDAQCYAMSLKGSAARLHFNSCRQFCKCLVVRFGWIPARCSLTEFAVWCSGIEIVLVCCDDVDVTFHCVNVKIDCSIDKSFSVEMLSLPPKF